MAWFKLQNDEYKILGDEKNIRQGTLGAASMPEMTSNWPHSTQIDLFQLWMASDDKDEIFFTFFVFICNGKDMN